MNPLDDRHLDLLMEQARPFDPSAVPAVRAAVDELVARTIPARVARRRAIAFGAGLGALALTFGAGVGAVAADESPLRVILFGADGSGYVDCSVLTPVEAIAVGAPEGAETVLITVYADDTIDDSRARVTVVADGVTVVHDAGCGE